jgi:diaminopimelate decarboxylase
MDHFAYKNGHLHAENVAIGTIAAAVGSPFYCYSQATLEHHVKVLQQALSASKPMVCFAVKANPNKAVLRVLADAGCGADVVSEGEARLAIAAGMKPEHMVFSGVGKTRDEMAYALDAGIFQFNVESAPELVALNEVAASKQMHARIAMRINPDVDAGTHAKISTGKAENKFGVAMETAPALYAQARTLPHIQVQGVSMHIGSQLTSLAPFREAYVRAKLLVQALRANGHQITTIDIGGGLGVPYNTADIPPPPAEYGALVHDVWGDMDARIIIEPGRLIAGNAGVLISRVLHVKQAARNYIILDAGMNDLMRPALYDAAHHMVSVEARDSTMTADIVGPVCESSDVFAKEVAVPQLTEGDLVALRTAGAYGASMSGTYNSRLLIPEVLVKGDQFAVIRKRGCYEDLLARDDFANWQ